MAYYEGEVSGLNNGSNGMFGDQGWWVIILFALIFGWGGNGYNYGNGGGTGAVDGYVLTSDFANIERKIDGVNQGLCDGFYAMNTGMLNGFSGIQQTLSQGFNGLNTSVLTSTNALQSQLASCCCDLKSLGLENRYLNERQTCDLITNANANTQRIIDYLSSEKLASLQAENAGLKAQISNDMQTASIVNALAPKTPIPAYPVFPTTSFAYPSGVTFGVNGNSGCGCGTTY